LVRWRPKGVRGVNKSVLIVKGTCKERKVGDAVDKEDEKMLGKKRG